MAMMAEIDLISRKSYVKIKIFQYEIPFLARHRVRKGNPSVV